MTAPGVNVSLLDTAVSVSISNTTGTAFVAGLTDRGSATAPNLVSSLSQFEAIYGARQSYSVLYDWLDTFFREGGQQAYIGRVVGPDATKGYKNLLDTNSAVSLVATAIGPGAWSNTIKVGVAAGQGSNFQIVVKDANDVVLEQSSDLVDQNAAIYWSQYSNYIRITLGATALLPIVVSAAVMSAGTDDRGSIVDAQWATALALFSKNLGPGQVIAPGRTTTTGYGQLKTHAEANGRVFLADATDSATVGTHQASAASIVSRQGAMFAPWLIIPGLTTTTTRTVPPTALIAGLIARNDPIIGTNTPSAGINGVARFCTDISQSDWNETDRGTLNAAGVNVIRRMFGGIRNYGWRSLTPAASDPSWVDFGNARLYTDLSNALNAAAENFVFAVIDGQNGRTVNAFHNALAGVIGEYYFGGQLFGDTPSEAFVVDTGPSVNTLITIAANELHAQVRVRMAGMAESVSIQIVKRQITQLV